VDVDGGLLLNDLEAYYRKYVRIPEEAYPVAAAWVLHCHAFIAFTRTPYLHLTSPVPECGKTVFLEITENLVPKACLAASLSEAVLGRYIEQHQPTLLLDELDKLLAGNKDLRNAVMSVINSGYKKSGKRIVNQPVKGGGWEAKELSTFCPKILASISDLPPDTQSRCTPIRMERLAHGERVAEIDEYITEPEANALFGRAQDWAKLHLKELRDARPDAPSELGHRQREVCRPLLAVADTAGGEWGDRLRGALIKIFTTLAAEQPSDLKILALAHVREVLEAHAGEIQDHVRSADLCKWLAEIEDGPWASWGKSGKPINQNQLARQLKGFALPAKIRQGQETARGYSVASLKRAFDRYPPSTPDSNRNTGTSDDNEEVSADFKPEQIAPCSTLKTEESPLASTDVPVFHFKSEGMGGDADNRGKADVQNMKPTLRSCPDCGSYALYKNPDGTVECLTCGPSGPAGVC